MHDETLRQQYRYDEETGDVVSRKSGKPVGSPRHDGYLRIRLKSKTLGNREWAAHRVAWFLHFGAWPSADLDHINGNKHDNRIANLRLANRTLNAANIGPYSNNKIGLRGVIQVRSGRFRAAIRSNGADKYLGTFDTPEAAARAYDSAAREAFGGFARTNYSTT